MSSTARQSGRLAVVLLVALLAFVAFLVLALLGP